MAGEVAGWCDIPEEVELDYEIVFDIIVEGSHRVELANGVIAMDFEGLDYDSGVLADSLNQIEKRGQYAEELPEREV